MNNLSKKMQCGLAGAFTVAAVVAAGFALAPYVVLSSTSSMLAGGILGVWGSVKGARKYLASDQQVGEQNSEFVLVAA